MVPIFMIKSEVRRSDGRNDEIGEYLRNEYGSSDRAWLMVENDHHVDKAGAGVGARIRARLGRKPRGEPSFASEAGS